LLADSEVPAEDNPAGRSSTAVISRSASSALIFPSDNICKI
jgi:hypothetical protein